jgi:two-component system LytT family response regulator
MSVNVKIRVLVVDDEPNARRKIRSLLSSHADVEIIRDCKNGYEAIAAIKEHTPDLVFLDVEMPEIDGFGVLERVEEELRPLVIFVTDYVKYAVKGYDVSPLHFLLKPLDQERFDEALRRARAKLAAGRESDVIQHQLARIEAALRATSRHDEYHTIKAGGGRNLPINKKKIDWVAAEEKYIKIHAGGTSYLERGPLKSIEAELDPKIFVLIYRSYIVNINFIKEIRYISKHEHEVVLRDGTRLPLSEAGRKRLAELLGISL